MAFPQFNLLNYVQCDEVESIDGQTIKKIKKSSNLNKFVLSTSSFSYGLQYFEIYVNFAKFFQNNNKLESQIKIGFVQDN